ncbi:unnamed protein product [Phytophthora fragariaefolia]|uniref:Unnamed protein product n=1 Tax=Phytophthora fragariaefolia TaxID=1490495 RepID=A0A9W7CR46_9STRA|nr:unnamed protein product [Phytophthora fragariaefolia]
MGYWYVTLYIHLASVYQLSRSYGSIVLLGYRGTVSGDLQQLATRVLWVNELWSQVKNIRQPRSHDQGRRHAGRQDEGRRDEGRTDEGRRDDVGWFEDHVGEDVHQTNGSLSPPDDTEDIGSGRQVVIAPIEAETSNRGKARGRNGRTNGKRKGKNGRRRSRSRSRERPRKDPYSEKSSAPMVADAAEAPRISAPMAEKKKKKKSAEGSRGTGGKTGKKRKRNGTSHDRTPTGFNTQLI